MPTRRDFIKHSAIACSLCPFPLFQGAKAGEARNKPVEARFYEKKAERQVVCLLCPRECVVADRERGYCGVRENSEGTYHTLVHSSVCSENVDPVEKKPIFHFLPGSTAYSIATAGCNMECKFCQNWEISQFRPEQVRSVFRSPMGIARIAKARGCRSIAYTYSEPVVFYEYMYDCAKAGREAGVKSVMISNGYIQEQPLRELVKILDAVKIDLKAFTEKFYREMCSATLKPVLRTLEILKDTGIWFEIVVLIIPLNNDSPEEIKTMCGWIAKHLGDSVPVHFTRFHPTYKIKDLPRTPLTTLEKALEGARSEGLKFVYLGNVPGHEAENTNCPKCGKVVIARTGYQIASTGIDELGRCKLCGEVVPGIWT